MFKNCTKISIVEKFSQLLKIDSRTEISERMNRNRYFYTRMKRRSRSIPILNQLLRNNKIHLITNFVLVVRVDVWGFVWTVGSVEVVGRGVVRDKFGSITQIPSLLSSFKGKQTFKNTYV